MQQQNKMNMESDSNLFITMYSLPDELISLVLVNCGYQDIISFGMTCKLYNGLIKNNQFLWKCKSRDIVPWDIYNIFEQHCNGDWYEEFKKYFSIKQLLLSELGSMSAKHYWEDKAVSLASVDVYFSTASTDNVSYYYSIRILQDIIKECRRRVDTFRCEKPYTMTEMYYAQTALRYLMHLFLSVKWTQGLIKKDLRPIKAINFFVQWVDTDNMHHDDHVSAKIKELADLVKALLKSKNPHHQRGETLSIVDRCVKGEITEVQVLAAVTQVIYQHCHLGVTTVANLEAIDVIKVMNNKVGNCIVVAAIYQEVAKQFGVNCELMAFENHLFLEWRDNTLGKGPIVYTINLNTGQLQPKRRCPFAPRNESSHYNKYNPNLFIQYLNASYMSSMGAYKNWNTENAFLLMGFVGRNYSAYSVFLRFLYERSLLPQIDTPLNLKYLTNDYRLTIRSLINLYAVENVPKSMVVKKNDGRIKFAVGMICYHKTLQFTCIIKEWDYDFSQHASGHSEIIITEDGLESEPNQPFYHVIAADQSNRCVAQAYLTQLPQPSRLYHLEHLIAREFTHFNGFAYVPNAEKISVYPDDIAVAARYDRQSAAAPRIT